jgi:hypothetical protein
MPLLGQVTPTQGMSPIGFGVNVDGGTQQSAANLAIAPDRNPLAVGAGVLGLGGLDLADTVASSIPGLSSALGQQRGDLNRYVLSSLDVPGLNDFYHNYKGGIEATSGVMGIVGSELVARKLTAPAGAFMGLLRELPYARRLATLDEQYNEAVGAVRSIDMNLAARGTLGAEQYVGRTVIDSNIFDPATNSFTPQAVEMARNVAVRNTKLLGAAKNVFHAGVVESVMAATLNQNGFLYDDSAAQNMAWQSFGLVAAGGAGWLQGAYAIRKAVNSDEIRRAFQGALDPEGFETARLQWKGKAVDPLENFLGGVYTDSGVNYSLNSRYLTEAPLGSDVAALQLAENRSKLATQWEKQAQTEYQKVTIRGISSNPYTKFSLDAPGYGNHLKWAVRRDPAAMYGVEQMGGIAEDMGVQQVHLNHVARIQERIDAAEEKMGSMLDDEGNLAEDADPDEFEKVQKTIKRLDFESSLTPMAMVDGEFMPISEAESFTNWQEPKISFTADDKVGGVKGAVFGSVSRDNHGLLSVADSKKGGVSLDTGFIYHIPGKNKGVNNADLYDVMNLYRLADSAINRMARMTGPLTLPKNPDWFQLDMAEELLRRSEGRANVVFPEGMTRDQARIESLIQKSGFIKQWDVTDSNAALKAETTGNTYEGQLSKLRLRYNLPRLSAYERGILGSDAEHPVMSLLRGLGTMPEDEIRNMSLPDAQEAMAQFKRIGDVAPVQQSDLEDMGGSFSFMKDENGNPVRPLLAYKRPFKEAEWTFDTTAERLAAGKMWALTNLSGDNADPFTKALTQGVINSPDFDDASHTNQLMDTQIQGGIAGASPQSVAGAVGNALRTTDWRDRDNITMLAASRLRQMVTRMTNEAMKAATAELGQASTVLTNPRNASTKLLLNQFHSFGRGWDIAKNPVQMADGMYGFVLKPTQENAERFKTLFGREMDKNQLLISPKEQPVVLDEQGLGIQNVFNKSTDALRESKNTVLRANGLREIDYRDWYIPPPATDGKYIGFTFGPDGKVVPNLSVVADSPADFEKQKSQVLQKIQELGTGFAFRSQDSIRDFASIWDKAQMDFISPGITAVQPGKRQLGKLAGQSIDLNAFQNSLKTLQDGFQSHGTDVLETLFREQIASSKARSAVSDLASANRASKVYSVQNKNIYDMYLDNLLGRSKLNNKSMVGNLYRTIEGPIDKFLAEATPPVAKTWQAFTDWVGKTRIWDKSDQARKDFDALSQKLGAHMPFDDALQLSEARGYGAPSTTLKKLAGDMNQFSAAMILRMFETAQPLMNLSGILNAAPAVVRNFTPNRGESLEDFASRVGHSATIFTTPEGATYGVPDIVKMVNNGFKRAWSKEAEPDFQYMMQRGYIGQEVAQFQRAFGTIDSRSSWEKFFYGDPNRTGFRSKGVAGWTGILSDKSEDFSRSWAHMIGLNVAEDMGITQMDAKHSFAHDVANKMIANYSPNNRPEIFQGALGTPLGLFQSFIINYYERLFRYVEQGDYRALATQYATQAGLFGVSSLPGWQEYNSWHDRFFSNNPADENTATRRLFGQNGGDLIAHGLLSNLPALFGQQGGDLYSRGDVSIRQFQIADPSSITGILNSTTPAWNVMSKLYQGITSGIDLFRSTNPKLTHTEIGETLSNMIANRPLAGWVEQFLGNGNHTDQYGQIVTQTKGAMEMAYRLVGIRSQRQSDELEAFYANRNAQAHQAALQEQLSLHTRQLLRGGDYDAIPQVFDSYVKQGGDPRNFRRWLKTTYIAATNTRGQQQLAKVAKDPEKFDQVLRLLDSQVTVGQDAATPPTDSLYNVDAPAPDQQPQPQ